MDFTRPVQAEYHSDEETLFEREIRQTKNKIKSKGQNYCHVSEHLQGNQLEMAHTGLCFFLPELFNQSESNPGRCGSVYDPKMLEEPSYLSVCD